ncbi:bluetail domain-containing putative surface protein [Enterobacter asburiae]|uniref:bluetail domain-containing putative surface protein n=1 Tax=Enterobacter asburiae TaxID=61645 RepID=UPI0039B4FF5D
MDLTRQIRETIDNIEQDKRDGSNPALCIVKERENVNGAGLFVFERRTYVSVNDITKDYAGHPALASGNPKPAVPWRR